jgi:anti-sigma factor ChrR (cupin superfamily)
MLRCKEVTTLVASGGLEDAGLWLRMKVRLHLMMCRHCTKYAAQMRAIGSSMRERFPTSDVEDLQRKILESADKPEK